jgi:hypothetical protein
MPTTTKGYMVYVNHHYHAATKTKAHAQKIIRELRAKSGSLDVYTIIKISHWQSKNLTT